MTVREMVRDSLKKTFKKKSFVLYIYCRTPWDL